MMTSAVSQIASSTLHSTGLNFEPSSNTSLSFEDVLRGAGQQMNQLQNDAENQVTALLRGDGTDIHTAMIATQKADLSFEMALAVRNKVVSAYQQLMNTQF